MATNKVHFRLINLSHFFQKLSPTNLRTFEHSEKLL